MHCLPLSNFILTTVLWDRSGCKNDQPSISFKASGDLNPDFLSPSSMPLHHGVCCFSQPFIGILCPSDNTRTLIASHKPLMSPGMLVSPSKTLFFHVEQEGLSVACAGFLLECEPVEPGTLIKHVAGYVRMSAFI